MADSESQGNHAALDFFHHLTTAMEEEEENDCRNEKTLPKEEIQSSPWKKTTDFEEPMLGHFYTFQKLLKNGMEELDLASAEIRRVVKHREQEILDLRSKIDHQQENLIKYKNMEEKLRKEIEKQRHQFQAEMEMKKNENLNLKKKIEEIGKTSIIEIEKLQSKLKDKDQELQNLKNELKEKEELLSKQKSSPSSSSLDENVKKDFEIQIKKKEQEIEVLNSTIALMTSELEEYRSHPDGVNTAALLSKDGELKVLRARLEQQREEMQALREQLLSKGKQDEVVKNSFTKEIQSLRTQLAFKEEELRAAQEELNMATTPHSPILSTPEKFKSSPPKRPSLSPPSPQSPHHDEEDHEIPLIPSKKQKTLSPSKKSKASPKTPPLPTVSSSPPKEKPFKFTPPSGEEMDLDSSPYHTITTTKGVQITIRPAN